MQFLGDQLNTLLSTPITDWNVHSSKLLFDSIFECFLNAIALAAQVKVAAPAAPDGHDADALAAGLAVAPQPYVPVLASCPRELVASLADGHPRARLLNRAAHIFAFGLIAR